MTRCVTINLAAVERGGAKEDHHIRYENIEGRPILRPICIITFVFPRSSHSIIMDAARLRENSGYIQECIEKEWFNSGGRLIYLPHITPTEFKKYMAWVKYLKLSRSKLRASPSGFITPPAPHLEKYEECLTMDRLVHWWLLGDAMRDDGLKVEVIKLLDMYAGEGYELPIQSFELGWVKSKGNSELRRWIFNMLSETLTRSVLQQRGPHMPADLLSDLLVGLMKDKEDGNKRMSSRLSSPGIDISSRSD